MSRDEADAELDAADAAIRDASSSLIALEDHPGYVLLRSWPLSGASARRWDETAATVAELHADLGRYRDVVDRAHAARGTRTRPSDAALAEVAALLHGPSIQLDTEVIPLQRRGLLGPAEVHSTTTPPELLARMTAAFDAATAVAARAAAVWDAVATRLDPLDTACTALVDDAVEAPGVPAPARLRDELTELRRTAMADPLVLDPEAPLDAGRLAAVRSAVATLTERRDALVSLRADLGGRLSALDAALAELGTAEDAATDSAARVARVVDTRAVGELPAPVRRLAGLRARRQEVEAVVATRQWPTVLDAITGLEREVTGARRRADGDRAVLDGLLERRAELRGRLGALIAKAAARGRAEDLDLDALRHAAQDLLWTAPCDLAASTVAVRRYQRALDTPSGRHAAGEPAEPGPVGQGVPPGGDEPVRGDDQGHDQGHDQGRGSS